MSNGNRSRETPEPFSNSEAKPAHDMCVLLYGGKACCCLAFYFSMTHMLANDIHIVQKGNVYSPREDSYLLAEAVEVHAFGKVLDMGTGTGIQGIIACKKGCDVTFADLSEDALSCARDNAQLNSVTGKFVKTDLFHDIAGRFNTILFNPPYLDSAPIGALKDRDYALDGGKEGREIIDSFLSGFRPHVLQEHVVLLLESTINHYEKDIKRLDASVACSRHVFFEELAVLMFR